MTDPLSQKAPSFGTDEWHEWVDAMLEIRARELEVDSKGVKE